MDTDHSRGKAPHRDHQRKLRNYLINPAFQWKYTGAVVAGVFLVSALLSVVLFGTLYQQARARVIAPATAHAWANTIVMVVASLSFSTIMALACGLWSIIVTHRISGPLFVVKRCLTELSEGRFPGRRALRGKDEFKDLYDALWQAIDASKARQRADLDTVRECLKVARSAAAEIGPQRQGDLESVTAQLEILGRRLAEPLGDELDDALVVAPDRGKVIDEPAEAYAELPG